MDKRSATHKTAVWFLLLGATALMLSRTLAAPANRAEERSSLLAKIRAGRHDEVISVGLDAVETNPADLSSYSLIFLSLEQTGSPADTAAAEHVAQAFERLLRARPGEAHYLYAEGAAYLRLGDVARGRRQLRMSIASGADFWEAYDELVNGYAEEDDIIETAGFLEESLRRSPSNPLLLQAAGIVHYYLSEYQEAFDCLEKALRIYQARGLTRYQIRCLINLSDVFTYFNDYPSALDRALTGLNLARQLGDRTLEAQCLERSAFVWNDLGNDPKAYEACSRALSLAQELASRKLEVSCLRTMGVILLERGDLAGAEDRLSNALTYYQRTWALRSEDVCLYWLTLLFRDKADYSKAMGCANEALQISRRIGFKTAEAFHLTTIGDIYLALGDYGRALSFNKQALNIAEKYIGKWSREECLNTIGFVYMELGDYARALASFEDALHYIQRIGHRREEARCLYNIGYASLKLGDIYNAWMCFRQSLTSAQKTGKRIIVGCNYNRLGDLYRGRELWDRSMAAYAAAASMGREVGQPSLIWEAHAGLGALCESRKDIPAAIEHYKEAVAIVEDLRSQLEIREYSAGFFQSKIPIYEALVNLLYERYQETSSSDVLEDCLYYAEKAKARALLDDLQRDRIDASAMPRERAEELELVSRKISRLSAELSNGDPGRPDGAALREHLEQLTEEHRLLIAKTRAEYSRFSRTVPGNPCRLEEIRRRILGPRTGLLEYFVGDKNLFVFAITRDRLTVHRVSPPDARRTLALAENYAKLLSSKAIDNADVVPAGRRLYAALIGLVGRETLSGLTNLIVIPDRSLNFLPFEALVPEPRPDEGSTGFHFLMDDVGISYAPSASTLVSILDRGRGQEAQRDWLAIGDPVISQVDAEEGRQNAGDDPVSEYYEDKRRVFPPLAFASREMRSIAKLIAPDRRRIVSGSEASEEQVKKLPLGDYRVIHFATHSFLDRRAASRSALFLTKIHSSGEDGFLEAREIYEMSLNADLVVLSACQTAGGKMERGEGVEGLARAFFCAGARTVLASLWNVNDESASRFMVAYYRYLTLGKTKQEALRLTKLAISRARDSRPYYWAAFVLIGEGAARIALHRPS
jgi:CHAT domain-containing protein/tetratricopeptide (TPR) repeat protein